MRKTLFIVLVTLLLASVSAMAGMIIVDDEVLSDVNASMGARFDYSGHANADLIAIKDEHGNSSNPTPGWLILTSVDFSHNNGSGDMEIRNLTMDIGGNATTKAMALGIPQMIGSFRINSVSVSNGSPLNHSVGGNASYNDPSVTGPFALGISISNVSTYAGSVLMIWAH